MAEPPSNIGGQYYLGNGKYVYCQDYFNEVCGAGSLAVFGNMSIAKSESLAMLGSDFTIKVHYDETPSNVAQGQHMATPVTLEGMEKEEYILPISNLGLVDGKVADFTDQTTRQMIMGTSAFDNFKDIEGYIDQSTIGDERKLLSYIKVDNLETSYLFSTELSYLESNNCSDYSIYYSANSANHMSIDSSNCSIYKTDGGNDIASVGYNTSGAYIDGESGADKLYSCAEERSGGLERELCNLQKGERTLVGGSGDDSFYLSTPIGENSITYIKDFRNASTLVNEKGETETDNDVLILPESWRNTVRVCKQSDTSITICNLGTGKVLAEINGNISKTLIDKINDGETVSELLYFGEEEANNVN